MAVTGKSSVAQRTRRTEVACARALLDELEVALDAETDARTQGDVVVQIADQLACLAKTMKQWDAPDAGEPRELRYEEAVDSLSSEPNR